MLKTAFENLRSRSPLIHNITNYVTVNDCANMVLACGASPIMADDAAEVEDITTICGGLNINIGTLNSRTIESMLKAGKKANALGHPVVLDPVGAGASALRTETACRLLDEVRFTVIRGNISEVKTLASGAGTTKGVDADVADWAHQAVDTFQNTYGEEPDLGVPYELETTYSTTRSTPSVLSIVWKTASYTGGAHGNLEITTTTYDMKRGALIDLYDVFENLDTALDVMSRYCTKALTKSLGDMYNDDMLRSGTAPEAENFSSFALTPEGIRIFFQPYQVAPWAAGSQVVDIPLDALADAGPRLSLWGK